MANSEMSDPSPFERQGVFEFELLPAEIRRMICYFAMIEPHPLPLTVCRSKVDRSFRFFAVGKDLRLVQIFREFRTEMMKWLYSENSFSFALQRDELEEETKTFPVDLGKIQKCYVYVDNMTDWDWEDDENEDPDESIYIPEVGDFNDFVETLIFEGHEMKYLLVECECQLCEWLVEGITPIALLRKIGLVHFRSCQNELHPYFRFLEDLMMSDRPLPFRLYRETFGSMITGDFDDVLRPPEFGGGTPPTGRAVDKSEEEMEVIARELYAVLGIEGDFIPQSELE